MTFIVTSSSIKYRPLRRSSVFHSEIPHFQHHGSFGSASGTASSQLKHLYLVIVSTTLPDVKFHLLFRVEQVHAMTLTLEVSYPFHSHLIGRSGQNINNLMKLTGTRIHFPDRNRIAGQSKSNKVVVRGELPNLENARQRLRVS